MMLPRAVGFAATAFLLTVASHAQARPSCPALCVAEVRREVALAMQDVLKPQDGTPRTTAAPAGSGPALGDLAARMSTLIAKIESVGSRLDRLEQSINNNRASTDTLVASVGVLGDPAKPTGILPMLAELDARVKEISERTMSIAVQTGNLDSLLPTTDALVRGITRSIAIPPAEDGSERLLGKWAQLTESASRERDERTHKAVAGLDQALATSKQSWDRIGDGTTALLTNLQTLQQAVSSIRCSPPAQSAEAKDHQAVIEEIEGTVREADLDVRIVVRLMDPSRPPALVVRVVDQALRAPIEPGVDAEWIVRPELPAPDQNGRVVIRWQIPREEFNARRIPIEEASLRVQLIFAGSEAPIENILNPRSSIAEDAG